MDVARGTSVAVVGTGRGMAAALSHPEGLGDANDPPIRCRITEYNRFDRVGLLQTPDGRLFRFGASVCTDFEPEVNAECWLVSADAERGRATLVNLTGQAEPNRHQQVAAAAHRRQQEALEAERRRALDLAGARANPQACLEAIERRYGFRPPKVYRDWVLEQRMNRDSGAYLWLPEMRWLEPLDIPGFEFGVEPLLEGLVPFATTPGGDYWCWWTTGTRCGDEADIVLCYHDSTEAELFAPTLAACLFRVAINYVTCFEDQSQDLSVSQSLRSWADLLDGASEPVLAEALRDVSAQQPEDYPTGTGSLQGLLAAAEAERLVVVLLGERYGISTRLSWQA